MRRSRKYLLLIVPVVCFLAYLCWGASTGARLRYWHSDAVVQVAVTFFAGSGEGLGFFVSPDGILVYSGFDPDTVTEVEVFASDNTRLNVEMAVVQGSLSGLTVAKVAVAGLDYLELGGDIPPEVGTKVYVFGHCTKVGITVNPGTVSGILTLDGGSSLLEVSIPVDWDCRLGPVLDSSGKLVGVVHGLSRDGRDVVLCVPASMIGALIQEAGAEAH